MGEQTKKNKIVITNHSSDIFRAFLTIWVASLAIFGAIVACSFQILAGCMTYLFLDKYKHSLLLGWLFRYFSSLFVVTLNPFWSLTVVGKRPKKRIGKTIVMSNHLSNSDPYFLCSSLLPSETKWISKSDLFNVPFGGWAMRLGGDIPIYFTSEKGGWGVKKGTIGPMMNHLKDLLNHDVPITVFPEGVRSYSGNIGTFKAGMFKLALETGADILPVAIAGSIKAFPRSDWKLDTANVYVTIGEAIEVKNFQNVEELMDKVKDDIQALQRKLPPLEELYSKPKNC